MDQDDLPPPKQPNDSLDDTSFAGGIGVSFAGFAWVAVFAAIAGLMLWGVMHWLR